MRVTKTKQQHVGGTSIEVSTRKEKTRCALFEFDTFIRSCLRLVFFARLLSLMRRDVIVDSHLINQDFLKGKKKEPFTNYVLTILKKFAHAMV